MVKNLARPCNSETRKYIQDAGVFRTTPTECGKTFEISGVAMLGAQTNPDAFAHFDRLK